MSRPRSDGPTPAELEILKTLWRDGPATVRQVMKRLGDEPPRAYTTIMSLLNVMYDKGLVVREPHGRAYAYRAAIERASTLRSMLEDVLDRAFNGSAAAMVAHLLDSAEPTEAELSEIRKTITAYKKRGG